MFLKFNFTAKNTCPGNQRTIWHSSPKSHQTLMSIAGLCLALSLPFCMLSWCLLSSSVWNTRNLTSWVLLADGLPGVFGPDSGRICMSVFVPFTIALSLACLASCWLEFSWWWILLTWVKHTSSGMRSSSWMVGSLHIKFVLTMPWDSSCHFLRQGHIDGSLRSWRQSLQGSCSSKRHMFSYSWVQFPTSIILIEVIGHLSEIILIRIFFFLSMIDILHTILKQPPIFHIAHITPLNFHPSCTPYCLL